MPHAAQFLPSHHGFAFTNSWPTQPAVVLPTPFGRIAVGDAGGGLCGGMVFAALDYWHAGAVPPDQRPGQGERLFAYVVQRLIDSWHLPTGVLQYYQWMNLPDGDRGFEAFGRHVVTERGLAWRTRSTQWPQIKNDLDHGIPVALGVVTVASAKPRDLALNHQVLAVNYRQADNIVTVLVYDPNQGRRDDISIRFRVDTTAGPTAFEHNLAIDHPVRGFFRAAYARATPPGNP
jgi:hypothetical protein